MNKEHTRSIKSCIKRIRNQAKLSNSAKSYRRRIGLGHYAETKMFIQTNKVLPILNEIEKHLEEIQ